jgi:hypothetical protein
LFDIHPQDDLCSTKGQASMFNRLQAIRAAVFGISFDLFCLLAGVIIGFIVHNGSDYLSVIIICTCIGLTLVTLCVTWATLKPYVIYGGLHSIVWFMAAALATGFNSPFPLAIGLFVSILLFVKLDQIMLFLYNLQRPRILFERAMPKQPRYEPGTPLDASTYYQGGYQPQKSAQDNEQTLFYPQSSDGQDGVQLQYPEM